MPINIDKSWTLFLDRDGVINQKLDDDYVKHITEFNFIEDAPKAIANFNKWFNRVVIVTNQQGINKGIFTTEQLNEVHTYMQDLLKAEQAYLDKIYFAPHLASENKGFRKPEIGMAKQAQTDFPEIDFAKSIIVGDSISDMQFGRNVGMKTVYISNEPTKNELIDFQFASLIDFCNELEKVNY